MGITIDNPTHEEFENIMAGGYFHPSTTFEDYLALCRERREMRAEAEREGWSAGYVEPPDLDDPEVQEALDRLALWAAGRTSKNPWREAA